MNLLSIVLGTVSLVFALHAFQVRGCLICCTGSLVSCGLSLLCQLGELYRLVCIGDMAAVYDTVRARFLAGSVLLGLTAALHLWALIRGKKRKRETC